jgi:transposase
LTAALLRQLDFHGHELRLIDAELARIALGCPDTRRLMTIPGVDVTVAMAISGRRRLLALRLAHQARAVPGA